MDPWIVIERTTVPGNDTELTLWRRDDDFAIRLAGVPGDLMNSRRYHSEEALAELACARLGADDDARVLVGGLGMGFTLGAVLRCVPRSAEVIVAELVPGVVEWNRGLLGQCAGRPLDDGRTRVHPGDVAELIKQPAGDFDAILLDVDNGPEAMTAADNEWLYSSPGLRQTYTALRPAGGCRVLVGEGGSTIREPTKKDRFQGSTAHGESPPGQGQPPHDFRRKETPGSRGFVSSRRKPKKKPGQI